MIKAVFFDLYNTLATFAPPREVLQMEAAREFGLELDPAGIPRGYVEADDLMTEQNAVRHIVQLSREERRAFFARYERLILQGAGVDASEELADKVWGRVRKLPQKLALFDDALPALRGLKKVSLIIGVISNMYQDLEESCRDLGMGDLVDVAVSSQSAGAEKPHAKIFQTALDMAGVEPQEALHVGDQYHGDVVGARGVGIHPVLLDRDGLLTSFDDVDRIGGLDEVVRFVG